MNEAALATDAGGRKKIDQLGGVILAGGQSRRMGGMMKALLPIGEQFMIERIRDKMRLLCGSVTAIVASEEQAKLLSRLKLPSLLDTSPGQGPLAALHTALEYSRDSALWVSACDMPFVSEAAAACLIDRMEASGSMAAVPEINGQLHPLQAVYRGGCLEQAERCLQDGDYSMKGFLKRITYVRVTEETFRTFGIALSFVDNINTPEQYQEALRIGKGV
ncbi:molybdopterin-guanine dinucleotide biosynthesis protein A [Paenibacillus catalpae]|uniref:Probable molybdenum cofactor guanylyltransferase n=1 Tax=Paenibacillus catalpae TaxID=1045775 RepID=A0A1I2F2D8_9BACL|nr:molybdenum cofactor guanylyltransferase [Paenibacillus catalpae]SFE99325.1 molybdopterin-guanine dinucleotide biosynthesis protein A [Paenibacillus catalpae]